MSRMHPENKCFLAISPPDKALALAAPH